MNAGTAYGIGRVVFGAMTMLAPMTAGDLLAGKGATTADAQAFLRGMGGRELGIGVGMLAADRAKAPLHGWLIAAVLGDAGDAAGIVSRWHDLAPAKRGLGLAMASAALVSGLLILAAQPAAYSQAAVADDNSDEGGN